MATIALQHNPTGHGTAAELDREADAPLWCVLDAIAARADRLSDLRAHRLETLAHATRLADSASLTEETRAQARRHLSAPMLLERLRSSAGGTIILVKGPELARLYPPSRLRPFNDIDVLVEDAERTQRELLLAGFNEVGEEDKYRGLHHLRPLHWPGSPLVLEVHSRPKWPMRHVPITFSELAAVAVPSSTGVAGIQTLPRTEHAVLVAAHGWAHDPLARLLVMIDIALLLEGLDRDLPLRVARRWGIERIWRTTEAAVDALFGDGSLGWPVRVWARGLFVARERTVLETHLARTLAPFAALPSGRALASSLGELRAQACPSHGEGWKRKLGRTGLAFRDRTRRISDHDLAVETRGLGHPPAV